jgi:negative regulator of flagellin synthesis FlgM
MKLGGWGAIFSTFHRYILREIIREQAVFNQANGREGSIVEVNKIGPNPTHTPPDNRNAKNSVVSSLTGQRRTVANSQTAPTRDTVALSTEAVDINALESRIKQLPDIDTARVVELHNRIMAGEYEIDSERLAGKILDLESTLDTSLVNSRLIVE